MKKRLARYAVFALVLVILLVAPAIMAKASISAAMFAQATQIPGASPTSPSPGDGVSVGTLIAIVSALLTAYGGTVLALVKYIHEMSKSKDAMADAATAAKAAQAEAHRAERAERDAAHRADRTELLKLVEKERDRNERQGEARAKDAMEATRIVSEATTMAMRVVDGLHGDLTLTTPTDIPSPVPGQRDSRTSFNPAPATMLLPDAPAPNTQKGRGGQKRNSNG